MEYPDKEIQAWLQDEARFGLQGTSSRVWALRGSRPRRVRQTQYEWRYMFAAVCPQTGQSNGWLMSTADTEMMNVHLRDISRQVGEEVHVLLLMDQAGWHTAKKLEVPENITIVLLPPYSPQLNPVELIWRYLRQRYLSNRAHADGEALEEAVAEAWNRFAREPERIVRMCSIDWILN